MRKVSFETVANLAVTLVAVLMAGVLVRNNFLRQPAAPAQSLVGSNVRLEGVNLGAADYTVLLALSPTCRFCKESAPFYRELVSMRRERGAKFQLVGAFRESSEEAKSFLSGNGISLDAVITKSPAALGVRGVPALLLIDPEGKVIQVWEGALDEAERRELMTKIRAA